MRLSSPAPSYALMELWSTMFTPKAWASERLRSADQLIGDATLITMTLSVANLSFIEIRSQP